MRAETSVSSMMDCLQKRLKKNFRYVLCSSRRSLDSGMEANTVVVKSFRCCWCWRASDVDRLCCAVASKIYCKRWSSRSRYRVMHYHTSPRPRSWTSRPNLYMKSRTLTSVEPTAYAGLLLRKATACEGQIESSPEASLRNHWHMLLYTRE